MDKLKCNVIYVNRNARQDGLIPAALANSENTLASVVGESGPSGFGKDLRFLLEFSDGSLSTCVEFAPTQPLTHSLT
jgi:hypothetical protein